MAVFCQALDTSIIASAIPVLPMSSILSVTLDGMGPRISLPSAPCYFRMGSFSPFPKPIHIVDRKARL